MYVCMYVCICNWRVPVRRALMKTIHSAALPAPTQQEIESTEQVDKKAQKEVGVMRQTIANYVDLMKPHVTVLLLGVTVAAMAIARQGLPPLLLVVATLLGGAMAAGSANCINCYIDRDIDQLMGRTRRRSLPSGKVQPRQALVFGF